MKFFLQFFCFICLGTSCLFSQDVIEYKGEKINAIDEDGLATGIWKVYDDENNIEVTTEFLNGDLVADTKYYKNKKLLAVLNIDNLLKIYKDDKVINAHYFKQPSGRTTIIDDNGNEIEEETRIYFFKSGQVMPMFYGGNEKLYEHINKELNPKFKNSIRGRVKINFTIDSVGRIESVKILESENELLNEELIRVVKLLPRWQPGHQRGIFVRCGFNLPITFK